MSSVITVTDRGLYCRAGDFYIDPWRPVERAVVTHAHSDHARWGSRRYHASRPSVPLLERRLGAEETIIGHAWGEPWRFGGATVSLHPAGHILGSAQVRVEVDGEVWVASGDYKRCEDPSCEPFEVVACDTFITEATFALPVYVWDDGPTIADNIMSWWEGNKRAGRASIVFGYSLGKAQRVLAELVGRTEEPVWVHGAVEPLTRIYRDAGIRMLETRLVSEEPRGTDWAGRLIVSPPSGHESRYLRKFGPQRTAFASGWMRVRGVRRRRGFDKGFVFSDHADWPSLIRTIEEVGCSRVLGTHGRTDVLVRYVREEMGLEADALKTLYEGETEE